MLHILTDFIRQRLASHIHKH